MSGLGSATAGFARTFVIPLRGCGQGGHTEQPAGPRSRARKRRAAPRGTADSSAELLGSAREVAPRTPAGGAAGARAGAARQRPRRLHTVPQRQRPAAPGPSFAGSRRAAPRARGAPRLNPPRRNHQITPATYPSAARRGAQTPRAAAAAQATPALRLLPITVTSARPAATALYMQKRGRGPEPRPSPAIGAQLSRQVGPRRG
ncbi:transmembrane protein 261-like protein [Platysternon megacephalum]|uniref:Transmembrane protein 261-like protein n=1 Tax=Platysternon megacephalum TaxID=55544 RepID=A0A4D9DPX3_9SAUR|nr:transmembrane protein 261-like protein [Platysternon megacephalum]